MSELNLSGSPSISLVPELQVITVKKFGPESQKITSQMY